MTHYCPCCGQRVLMRLGVGLSPKRADVFDAIHNQSNYGGIRSDVLAGMFGRACVKVHVNHINKMIKPKGWEIVCEREGSALGFYRIRQRKGASNVRRDYVGDSTTIGASVE
jgi:hypothetical protein